MNGRKKERIYIQKKTTQQLQCVCLSVSLLLTNTIPRIHFESIVMVMVCNDTQPPAIDIKITLQYMSDRFTGLVSRILFNTFQFNCQPVNTSVYRQNDRQTDGRTDTHTHTHTLFPYYTNA